MNNLVVLPIFLPFIAGVLIAIYRKNIPVQRWISALTIIAVIIVSAILVSQVTANGIQTLQVGGWEAPFGISLVADMFALLLILTTGVVSFACLLFAFRSIGVEREKYYFYPMFLFLVAGVNGSFLTGDLFNLFVNFELMLIASYVLITLGGTKNQLRESIKYVLINVLSSFLFLVGVAYLYSITGTLNMAHLSVRVAEAGQDGLLTTVALLFLVVFGIKAGLFLFFWLPGSYSVPPTAVAALFAALLTKVGIYAIFRIFTLIFYHEPQITHVIMAVLGGLTMLLGGIGAVAHWEIRKILAYNVIIAVGLIIAGLAAFTPDGILGAIYYLMHDMVVKALIFLLGGVMIILAGTGKLREMSGLIRNHPSLGWMFFIAALAIAGIPPLSGFAGKVLITKGTFEAELYWLGAIGLITSLMVLFSLIKIFLNGFFGETLLAVEEEKGTTKGLLFPAVLLTVITVGYGLGGEAVYVFAEQATEVLMNPNIYIEAVFNGGLPQ